MTWKGKNPFVTLAEKVYETAIARAEGIGKWFVTILRHKCKIILDRELKV